MQQIRAAAESDLTQINQIYAEWIQFAVWDSSLSETPADFDSVSDGERVFVCCDHHDHAIGVISIWEPESFIHHLYVNSQHKRTGVGRALLASLDQWLPKPWTLKCDKRNTSALDFYDSQGWRKRDPHANEADTFWLLELIGRTH